MAPEYLTAEMQRVRRMDVPRLDAWELAVRAHWHIAQFTREGNDEARNLLLNAVELDPDSTFGLADLAFVHLREVIFGWSDDFEGVMAEAERAAEKAVAVNNRDAFAYALLGAVNLYSHRHDAAVRRLDQAIELNPNDAHGHALLGRTLIYLGDIDAGCGHVDQALRLSPRDPLVTLWYGILCIAAFISERYEDAAEWASTAIRAQPNRNTAYLELAAAHAGAGNLDEAAEAMSRYRRMTPGATIGKAVHSHPFKRPKDRERYVGALRAAGLEGEVEDTP